MDRSVNENGSPDFIASLSVQGFKSLVQEQYLEIRPLTLLAGANSSGKSSALQPLLLLKQTLEAPYDPGPLLLDGPNVRFTSADQLLSRLAGHAAAKELRIKVEMGEEGKRGAIDNTFRARRDGGLDLVSMAVWHSGDLVTLRRDMSREELAGLDLGMLQPSLPGRVGGISRNRCFLEIDFDFEGLDREGTHQQRYPLASDLVKHLLSAIHVPGLRGHPVRTQVRTAVETSLFPGTFENYAAGVIHDWHERGDGRLGSLSAQLGDLGLTWTVRAVPVDSTRLEVLVGRLAAKRSGGDLVNIADVGFGVSQVLPVLVALLSARPGQLVYIEQPELHLHPRAQEALAAALAAAANRGVRVVAETHSSLLLLAVQTLVVEGKLSPDDVKLHWFQRDAKGVTQVRSAELDSLGAYGDWPEDFAQARSSAENRYLNAVESQVFPPRKNARKR